jgi:hypothetical protein
MTESQNNPEAISVSHAAERKQERTALAESLEGRRFAFPGILEGRVDATRADREECMQYFALTPWDEWMHKFQSQGMKVYVGKNGETHILPGDTVDMDHGVECESLMPRLLEISDDMDEGLKQLILRDRGEK